MVKTLLGFPVEEKEDIGPKEDTKIVFGQVSVPLDVEYVEGKGFCMWIGKAKGNAVKE